MAIRERAVCYGCEEDLTSEEQHCYGACEACFWVGRGHDKMCDACNGGQKSTDRREE